MQINVFQQAAGEVGLFAAAVMQIQNVFCTHNVHFFLGEDAARAGFLLDPILRCYFEVVCRAIVLSKADLRAGGNHLDEQFIYAVLESRM